MLGAQSDSTGNVAFDCMLALEGAGFTPGEVTPSRMSLALVRAQGKSYEGDEERPATTV